MRESKKQRIPKIALGEVAKNRNGAYSQKRLDANLADYAKFSKNSNWWEESNMMDHHEEMPENKGYKRDSRTMEEILKYFEE